MILKKTLTAAALALAILTAPIVVQKSDFVVPTSAAMITQERQREIQECSLIGFPIGFFQSAGLIQNLQPFAITIASAGTSNTGTVTSVDTTRSTIVYGGVQSGDTSSSDGTNDFCTFVLTNATTITITRTGTGAFTLIGKGTLIQWKSGVVKSISQGTIVIGSGSTSNTASFTAVTSGNAIVLFGGLTTSTNGTTGQLLARTALASTTTASATRNTSTTNTVTVGYCMFEFNSGILNSSTQSGTITGVTGTPQNSTITAVTMAQTWLIYEGQTVTNTGNSYNEMGYIQLTSTTNVQFTSGTGAIVGYMVCEFKLANAKSNSYAAVTTTTTTGTATFSAVNTSLAWVTFLGTICNTAISQVGLFDAVLTNTTTATIERNGGTTSATTGLVMMELTG